MSYHLHGGDIYRHQNVTDFSANCNPFGTPESVKQAAVLAMEEVCNYPDTCCQELREAIGAYEGVNPDWILCGNGAADLIFRLVLGEKPKKALLPAPVFAEYEQALETAGCQVQHYFLKEENGFLLDEGFLAAIEEGVDMVFVCNPNNPTGAIMEKEDLEALTDLIISHDILVISDEIYSELTYKSRHVSIASLPGMRERTIVIDGFSKAFAMTGWRLGYALAPAEIMHEMIKLHQFAIMSAPTTSQYAAISALKNGNPDVMEMRIAYDQRRRFLLHILKEMEIPCFEPYGAFYIFPDISKFGMTSEEFATELLRKQKVAVVPGSAFGACGEGFIRISYAYSIEELKAAFSRIQAFLAELEKK